MELLFIHSLLAHNYNELAGKLLLELILWFMVIGAVIADLIAGVYKAKQRKELRSSYGFKRTVTKFVTYFSALLLALFIDCVVEYVIVSFNSFIPDIPYATILISLYIIVFVEGRSILEKADKKQRKQLSEDVLNTLEFIDRLKDKEVLEYLQELAKDKKGDKKVEN